MTDAPTTPAPAQAADGAPAAPAPAPVTPAPPAAPPADSIMAKIMADPDARRAYQQLAGEKAERDVKVSIPATEQACTVDPAVRLQQLAYLEKHDSARFKVENLAAEREALQAEQAKSPAVRILDDSAMKSKMQVMDTGAQWLSDQGEGADAALQAARGATNDMLPDIGNAEAQTDFHQHVGTLPDVVQISLVAELAQPAPAVSSLASTEQLRRFRDDDVGKALLAEWGSEAPRKVQVLAERYKRIIKGMPPSAVAALSAWEAGLTDREVKSIARRMAR